MTEIQIPSLGLSRRAFLGGLGMIAGGVALSSCGLSVFGDTPTVGLVLASIGDPYFLKLERGALNLASQKNVTAIVDGPVVFDPQVQANMVRSLINDSRRPLKALIISPTSSTHKDLIASIQEANAKNIKIVTMDTPLASDISFPVIHVGSNHKKGGRLLAQSLAKGFGGIGSLVVDEQLFDDVNPAMANKDTFNKIYSADYLKVLEEMRGQLSQGFKDYANETKIPLTNRDQAHAVTDESFGIFALQVNKTIPDSLYGKLVNHIITNQDQGRIKLAVYDAYETTVTALRSGNVQFAVAQVPTEIGRLAMDYAIQAINGQGNLPTNVETGFALIDRNSVETPAGQAAIYRSN